MSEKDLIFYGIVPEGIFSASFLDYPSKDGCSVIVYFSGCDFKCRSCHNSSFREYGDIAGTLTYDEFVKKLDESCLRNRTNKVTLLGGDPLCLQNRDFTKYLLSHTNHDYCVYTGYNFNNISDYIHGAKFVKCGKFDPSKYQTPEKTDTSFVLASKNQKFYKFENCEYVCVTNGGIYEFT